MPRGNGPTEEDATRSEVADLRRRLDEAEDALRAIGEGEVDAIIVQGRRGEQIFSLSETENIYRLMVETMNEAGVAVSPDGTIVFANNRFSQMLGLELDHIVGRGISDFVASDHREAMMSLLSEAVGGQADGRISLVAEDGTSLPLHFWANSFKTMEESLLCLVGTDLTQLEASKGTIQYLRGQRQALAESEARFRSIFEQAAVGIKMIDRKGNILQANQKLCEIVEYERDELQRMTVADITHPDDHDNDSDMIAAMAAGEIESYAVEKRFVKKSGSAVPVRITSSLVHGVGDVWRIAIVEDTTLQKEAERGLTQALEELKRSNYDLEQFAYVASHDLQEPLRMVGSFMDLLRQRYHGQIDERANQYIEFALDGVSRMRQLIDDLLAYGRVDRMGRKLEPTTVRSALQRAIANLRASIEQSGARITYDTMPTAMADRAQLAQLFQNLLSNAMKFRRADVVPEIHVGARRQNGRWVIWVQDNGIGLPPEHRERVFMLFQRLHSRDQYPGTGMGLAICKRIAERHGGDIWVESETDKGSTFYFTLAEVPSQH